MANKKEDKEKVGILRDSLEILLALEVLEYHNKNWLAMDDKRRSEEKQELIRCVLVSTEGTTNT